MSEHMSDEELATIALSPEITPKIAAVQHLEGCAQCRDRVQGVQRAMRSIDELASVGQPALGAVRNQIEAELHASERSPVPSAPAEPTEPVEDARVVRIPPIRTVERLRAVFPLVASAVLAWIAGKGSALEVAVGFECAAVELASAGAMVAAFLIVMRGALRRSPMFTQAVHARATILLSSVAGTGALLAQVWLHKHCEAPAQTPHLFMFHFGAVLLATLLAASLAPIVRRGLL
jgi:hypothetical protein